MSENANDCQSQKPIFGPILALPDSPPLESQDFAATDSKRNLVAVPAGSVVAVRFAFTAYLTPEDFWIEGSPSVRTLPPGEYRLRCGHSRSAEDADFELGAPLERIFTDANSEAFEVR